MNSLLLILVTFTALTNKLHVSAMSRPLLEIFKYMEKEYDVFVISNKETLFSGRDEVSFDEVLQNFTIAFTNGTKSTRANQDPDVLQTLVEQSEPQVTKIIADFETIDQTLMFFSEIGDPQQGFQNESQNYWFLILWPDNTTNFGSLEEKKTELFSKLNTPTFRSKFPASSQVYVGFPRLDFDGANATAIHELFDFFEVYGLGEQLVVRQVFELGTTFLNCFTCPTQTIRRSDLQGVHLKVEGVVSPAFEEDPEFQMDTIYDIQGGELLLTDGFSVLILHMLQEALNFTYTASIMTPVAARGLGERSAWDGVVQRVANGQVDLGLSLTVQTADRWKRVAFLPPTDDYIISAFFRPSAAGIRDIFLHPFKADLWAAIFSTWMVLAFSMILFSAILKRVGAVDPNSDEPDFTETSLIWALATVCQQGWDDHPSSTSMRIIFIAASFTGVVAYAGYSAAIVSTLSSKNDPIQSPESLINSHLSIGMRGGFLDTILKDNDTEDMVTRIYRRLSKNPAEARVNASTGFNIVENKDFAFISVRDTFYDTVTQYRNDKEICDVRDLQLLKHGYPGGQIVAKSSPYKEFFRIMLIRIRERGALWRLRLMYTYTRRCLISQENLSGKALGANDVFTAFMILVGGYVLSFVNLAVEKLIYVSRLNYMNMHARS